MSEVYRDRHPARVRSLDIQPALSPGIGLTPSVPMLNGSAKVPALCQYCCAGNSVMR